MAKYFEFKKEQLQFAKYENGRTAIQLIDPIEELLCTVTVNLPEVIFPEGYVLIKDYSENEGVLNDLVKAGIIEEPFVSFPTGFIYVYLCKLLVNPDDY